MALCALEVEGGMTDERKGRVYDLDKLFNKLNDEYFAGKVHAFVEWSNVRPKGRVYYTLRLGSYTYGIRLIKIHRCLDRQFVPKFFVEAVMHHEMLHQIHQPVKDKRGHYHFHTPAFKRDEKKYRFYEEAQEWDRKNVNRLLTF